MSSKQSSLSAWLWSTSDTAVDLGPRQLLFVRLWSTVDADATWAYVSFFSVSSGFVRIPPSMTFVTFNIPGVVGPSSDGRSSPTPRKKHGSWVLRDSVRWTDTFFRETKSVPKYAILFRQSFQKYGSHAVGAIFFGSPSKKNAVVSNKRHSFQKCAVCFLSSLTRLQDFSSRSKNAAAVRSVPFFWQSFEKNGSRFK
jgi:hypothetical protein